jgi:hypothetical protein
LFFFLLNSFSILYYYIYTPYIPLRRERKRKKEGRKKGRMEFLKKALALSAFRLGCFGFGFCANPQPPPNPVPANANAKTVKC